jgi:hypothetical protein
MGKSTPLSGDDPTISFFRDGTTREKHTLEHCKVFDSDSGNMPVVNGFYVLEFR